MNLNTDNHHQEEQPVPESSAVETPPAKKDDDRLTTILNIITLVILAVAVISDWKQLEPIYNGSPHLEQVSDSASKWVSSWDVGFGGAWVRFWDLHPILGFLSVFSPLMALSLAWKLITILFASKRNCGLALMVTGAICGLIAFAANGKSDYETQAQTILDGIEARGNDGVALQKFAVAYAKLHGDKFDTSYGNSVIADSDAMIQKMKEELKQLSERRQSNRQTMIIIAGFLLVIGAILIK
jgi:hypothetical protein